MFTLQSNRTGNNSKGRQEVNDYNISVGIEELIKNKQYIILNGDNEEVFCLKSIYNTYTGVGIETGRLYTIKAEDRLGAVDLEAVVNKVAGLDKKNGRVYLLKVSFGLGQAVQIANYKALMCISKYFSKDKEAQVKSSDWNTRVRDYDGVIINHIDGNVYNNRMENLELCSRGENTLHGLIMRMLYMRGTKYVETYGKEDSLFRYKDGYKLSCEDIYNINTHLTERNRITVRRNTEYKLNITPLGLDRLYRKLEGVE